MKSVSELGSSEAVSGSGERSRITEFFRVPVPWIAAVGVPGLFVVAYLAATEPLLAIPVSMATVGALWLANYPHLVAILVVALVPATSGLARGLVVPELRLSELLVMYGVWVVLIIHGKALRSPKWRGFDYAAAAYTLGPAVFAVLNAITGVWAIDRDGIETVLGMAQFLLLYRVVVVGLGAAWFRIWALRLMLLVSLPIGALAVAQQLGPESFHELAIAVTQTSAFETIGYEPVRRATSVFALWHLLAGYLVVILLITVALQLADRQRVLPRWALILVTILAVAGIFSTLTFTPLIGTGLAVLYVAWRSGKLLPVTLGGVLIVVVFVVAFAPFLSQRIEEQTVSNAVTQSVPFLPQTLQYRLVVWAQDYQPVLSEHFATGLGPSLPESVEWQHTESDYLTSSLRGGFLYLLVFVAVMVGATITGELARRRARTPEDRAIGSAAAGLALALFSMNTIFPYLSNGGLAQAAWILWGLSVSVLRSLDKEATDPSATSKESKEGVGVAGGGFGPIRANA